MGNRLQDWVQNQFSLSPPQQDLVSPETAGDMVLGMVPGVGTAMSLRDMERARRESDYPGMAMSAVGLLPFGRLAGPVKKIIAGAMAKEAPYEAMLAARNALKKGGDAEKVWQDKGVFRGYDKGAEGGQLKWEIPDTNAKFKDGALNWKRLAPDQMGEHQFQGKLGDLVDHPEFFKNYPEAADWTVNALRREGPPEGVFHWNQGIEPAFEASGATDTDLMKTILHEAQHGVQRIENFGRGGNPDNQLRRIIHNTTDPNKLQTIFDIDSPVFKQAVKDSYEQYRRLPGEIESFGVEKRFGMTPEQLKQTSPLQTAKDMGYGPDKVHINDSRMNYFFEPGE